MKGDYRTDEEAQAASDWVNDRDHRRMDFAGGRPLGIRYRRLHEDAFIPQRGSLLAAGYDLRCIEDIIVPAETTVKIPLGFATELPPTIHGRIESRSGLALKGLVVLTGVIDADYRGEWNVILRNVNHSTDYEFAKGDKVAQCVFRPTVSVSLELVDALEDSERGAGGFGSTGR